MLFKAGEKILVANEGAPKLMSVDSPEFKGVSRQDEKLAEAIEFHNESEAIQNDPQNQAEAKKLDRVGYLAVGAATLALAVSGGKAFANKVFDGGTAKENVPALPSKVNMQPLPADDIDSSNIRITAETLRNMPNKVTTTVKEGETASEIAHRGFPQAPAGSALEQANIEAVSGDGNVKTGETVTVTKVPDYIQPNNGGETAHIDLNVGR